MADLSRKRITPPIHRGGGARCTIRITERSSLDTNENINPWIALLLGDALEADIGYRIERLAQSVEAFKLTLAGIEMDMEDIRYER
jgi:hypothetical protein